MGFFGGFGPQALTFTHVVNAIKVIPMDSEAEKRRQSVWITWATFPRVKFSGFPLILQIVKYLLCIRVCVMQVSSATTLVKRLKTDFRLFQDLKSVSIYQQIYVDF